MPRLMQFGGKKKITKNKNKSKKYAKNKSKKHTKNKRNKTHKKRNM